MYAERLQRCDGAARIAFRRRADGTTALADLYQRAPARVLFPDVEPGEPPQAVLLTTSGGLTGGDRLRLELEVGPEASATVATQAAEKLYRALEGDARIEARVTVGRNARAEWLAQETILFDGAALRRTFTADLDAGAELLAVESIVFGRGAMGERMATGRVHDAWRIRRGGRLVWADALHLSGDIAGQRALPFGFGTATACATLVQAGDGAEGHLEAARDLLSGAAGVRAGVTAFDGLLIARILADDPADMRRAVITLAAGLRHAAAGLPPRLPRVWYC